MNQIFKRILARICETPYFADARLRKRDSRLIFKTDLGSNFVDFTRIYYDCLVLEPGYCVKFDVLSRWFEKFSVIDKSVMRGDWCTIGYSGRMLDEEYKFEFYDDERDESEFRRMYDVMVMCCDKVFGTYSSLEGMYRERIVPMLKEPAKAKELSCYRLFDYLALAYLVSPEDYPAAKDILLQTASWFHDIGEPNMQFYYHRMDEIVSYMENNLKL